MEEALRYEPITPFTARILTEELTYRDVTFPQDTIVMVCAFTGNRDLGRCDGGDTDRFDITARTGTRTGDRARADVRRGRALLPGRQPRAPGDEEGLAFLAEHVRAIELDGEPEFEHDLGIYGLESLPLKLVL